MKRLLVCLLLCTGCAHWNVTGFGIPMQATDRYQQTSSESSGKLSSEEKWGVVLILGLAIGGGIAVAAAAN
jgi:hypothetical protein